MWEADIHILIATSRALIGLLTSVQPVLSMRVMIQRLGVRLTVRCCYRSQAFQTALLFQRIPVF